jgi:hypothetical protein
MLACVRTHSAHTVRNHGGLRESDALTGVVVGDNGHFR